MSAQRKLISIVTPCFQEEANIEHHFERVQNAIAPFLHRYDFEHIYTDNCSSDKTFELLRDLSHSQERVRALRFSRNIGSNRAVFFGLQEARGDAAILIQADLQDPPEMIGQFIQGWEEGYDVVFGQIQDRAEEGWILKNLRKCYYNLISRLADVSPPRNVGEFRLTSRRVLDALALYAEDNLYMRGAIAHIGYRQKAIPYIRAPRHRGRSSSKMSYLFAFALDGLVSTTVAPLRAVIFVGMATALFGFSYGAYIVVVKLLFPALVPGGVATLAALITFFAGSQLFALGVIAEYIRKIYVQSLRRPQGFIQDRVP